jgi:hypothetical protein
MEYQSGKVYKIYIPGMEEVCYIGSTIISIEERFAVHKSSSKSDCKYKFASAVLFNDGNEPVVELVEAFPCNSKQELLERERYWLDKHPDAINKNLPIHLTDEERYNARKEAVLKYHRANKEKVYAKTQEWREANKERIAEYDASRREIDKAQAKARYDAGYKEKLNEAKKVKVACEICNKIMNKNSIWTHKKSVHKTD